MTSFMRLTRSGMATALLLPLLLCTAITQAQYHPVASGDFDNDGFADLVIGVPNEDIGSVMDAGAVHVIYGSSSKLSASGNQFWHQNSSGILDSCESDDLFGKALAVGDFNGDGFDDLAIGVPDESVGSVVEAGAVNVLYGSSAGLRSSGPPTNQLWTQNSSGVLDVAESADFFGIALAAGDFNGDGFADLAIGASDEDIIGVVDAGAVNVLYGSAAGLSAAGDQLWTQNSSGVLDIAETADYWGFVLAAGDFNGDGFADLAVTSSDEDISGVPEAGAVNILYGSASGLTATNDQFWHQNSTSVLDVAEADDFFGGTLAVGDFDGDGYDDLALGMRLENVGSIVDAGAVAILYGSAAGLSASRDQFWHQNSSGILDTAETNDYFGTALIAGDFNHDGKDDLAIGILLENGNGAVAILRGSSAGLTATGNQLWSQDSAGVEDVAEFHDEFGSAMIAGDFNGDLRLDLAIGVPGEDIGGIANAGAVNVLYGTSSGLSATGDQLWYQNRSGVLDACEAGDGFGGDPLF